MSVQIENEIVMRPINTVKPYIRNPRKNSKTVELLCQIIPKVGFNVPLVIDERGIIVKGHARFTAAIRLGMKEVPCIITHADEEAIKADRITDNKISEFSEWVDDELIQEVNDINFDLSDIGLPKVDFDAIPGQEEVKQDIVASTPAPATVESLSEEQKDKMYQEFKAEQEAKPVDERIAGFGDIPYYKAICDKCGCIMFFKEGEL